MRLDQASERRADATAGQWARVAVRQNGCAVVHELRAVASDRERGFGVLAIDARGLRKQRSHVVVLSHSR